MNLIVQAIPFFFGLIALEVLLAWLLRKRVYRLTDSLADLSCGILSQLIGLFTKGVGLYMYALSASVLNLPEALGSTIWNWNGWVSWMVAFVAVDFCYYWTHRLSHQVNILWAGHVVHHSSEEYNLTVALRQSSFHGLFTWVFYLPLAVAGIPWEVFGTCYALNLIYQFWVHTQLVRWLGPLEYVLVSPSNHRVHHAVNPEYLDKNHGGVFIVWDILFGTFKVETTPPVYGITKPLASWNPLWANLHTFWWVLETASRTRSLVDALKVLFGPPGWQPAYLGGSIPPRKPDQLELPKYEPEVSKYVHAYGLVQFVMLLGGALAVLLAKLDTEAKLIPALTLVFLLSVLGEVLEGKRWTLWVEGAKPLLFATLGLIAYHSAYWALPVASLAAVAQAVAVWQLARNLNPVTASAVNT
jgi:sterol desaturase/sphingolipid hydroxylase (fatty acid hydroxylase superfamily)